MLTEEVFQKYQRGFHIPLKKRESPISLHHLISLEIINPLILL